MGKDVMVALDFPSGEKALAFLDLFAKEERKPAKCLSHHFHAS